MHAALALVAALGIGQARPGEAPPSRPAGEDPRFRKEWWGEPVEFGNEGRALLRGLSPDGKRAVVYHNLGMVCVDLEKPEIVWYRDYKEVFPLYSAVFSPDGKLIATAEGENGANLYDAATGTPVEMFLASGAAGEKPIQAGFLPDGKLVVLTARYFHTPEKGKPQAGGKPPDNTLSYSLIVWDPAAKKELRRTHDVLPCEDSSARMELLGTKQVLELNLATYENGRPANRVARYIDPLTGKSTPEIPLGKDDGRSLGLTPDGKSLLTMTSGEAPRLADVATGKVIHRFEGHKRVVTDADLSPDGKLVAAVSGGYPERFSELYPDGRLPDGPSELFIWEAATARVIARYQFPSAGHDFKQVEFSPDGKWLYVNTAWSKRALAWGQLPFPRPKADEHVGIPNLPMPQPKPQPPAAVPKPAAVVPPPASGGLVADALDKLAEDLPKSGRPAAQQIDALFLAALGRLPTAAEVKKIGETYKTRLTPDVLRKIIAELVASPEFEAHVKTLGKRLETKKAQPFRWEGGPAFPGAFPNLSGMPLQSTFPNVLPPPPMPKKP
jgi:hypothetical protein